LRFWALPFLTGKEKTQPRMTRTLRARIFLLQSAKISEIRGKSFCEQTGIPSETGEPVFVIITPTSNPALAWLSNG
jgi:hypothetical protein